MIVNKLFLYMIKIAKNYNLCFKTWSNKFYYKYL